MPVYFELTFPLLYFSTLSGRRIRRRRRNGLPRAGHRLLLDPWPGPVTHPAREDFFQSRRLGGGERHLVVRRRDRLQLALDDVRSERTARHAARKGVGGVELVVATRGRHLPLDDLLRVLVARPACVD